MLVLDTSVTLAWCFPDETSAYADAAYLDVATRLALPIATFDTRLAAAAQAAGVPVFAP